MSPSDVTMKRDSARFETTGIARSSLYCIYGNWSLATYPLFYSSKMLDMYDNWNGHYKRIGAHPGCNIVWKTLLSERGKVPLKLTCPAQHFRLPRHSVKQGWDWTLPKTLLAERGKLWSCSACPIAIFCQIHFQLATGPVVMLHAVISTAFIAIYLCKSCMQLARRSICTLVEMAPCNHSMIG